MKHLLNNISEEEKNRIREQHTGGMKIAIDNFKKLVETKLGDAKPFINEANMETCEQCGNELTEGGECMECGSMYEEEMMEQTKLLPKIDNVKVWMVRNMTGEGYYDVDLKGNPSDRDNMIRISGEITSNSGSGGMKGQVVTLGYDCNKKEYKMFGDYFNGPTVYLSDDAKAGLKMETWCKTYK